MSAASDAGVARSGPWFGRGEILDALDHGLESIRLGHGQLILIFGEGGVGKSALLTHLRESAKAWGFRVLYGRALPSELPEPFALTQNLLRTASSRRGPRGSASMPSAAAPADGSGVLSLFLAPYKDRSGNEAAADLDDGTPAESLLSALAGSAGHVGESRLELSDQLVAYLEEMAEEGPVLLAIDDLNLADEPSLEFLLELAGHLRELRIGLVATLPAVPAGASPASPLFQRLVDYPGAESLTVRRMTESEAGEYARWILHGRTPSRDELLRWHTQTDGNPLFLEYVVRGTPGAIGSSVAPGARDVDAILRAQVSALSDDDRRLLVHAAVLGKEFDFSTLLRAMERTEEEPVAEGIDRLVHRGLVREVGEEVYEFVSERIRAEAYGLLTETRRQILHKKAAYALEARGRSDPAAVFELARQFYLARDAGPAISYNRRAAEIAVRTYAYPTAVIYLERALECLPLLPTPDLATELLIRIELGRLLDELAGVERGEEVLEEAIRRARDHPEFRTELALALLWLARLRIHRSSFLTARELATEAYGILEPFGHDRGVLVAHRVLSVVCLRLGDLTAAEQHCHEAVQLADRVDDPHLKWEVIVDLANVIGPIGRERFDEAIRLYRDAARFFEVSGDHGARARVLLNEGVLYGTHHRIHEALRSNNEAIESAEKSRSRVWIGYTFMNQAQYLAELHDPAAGRIALARAAEVLRPLGDIMATQQILMIGGILCEEEGNFSGAEEAFVESLQRSRESPGMVADSAELLFRRARLALREERRDEARRLLAESRAEGLETLCPWFADDWAELDRRMTPPSP
ncbi:MAG: AAA family ATPase [Thermoplasmata archaeon]|nr:AAA family ATPase [Thermoplasmata archaeon]